MSLKITSKQNYLEQCQLAKDNPDQFWSNIANNFSWFQKWNQISNCNLEKGRIEWFQGAKLNILDNCLDRHLEKKSDDVAIIWEANDPKDPNITLTYRELFERTCQFANLLKANGVKKGDVVTIYMPTIPEAIFAMLVCARIGAIHSVVFAGFSAESLADRIEDCNSKFLITSDLVKRSEKNVKLIDNVKNALKLSNSIKKSIIFQRMTEKIFFVPDLPKTRSGKIMRRILRISAAGGSEFGDISTSINPNIVKILGGIISTTYY